MGSGMASKISSSFTSPPISVWYNGSIDESIQSYLGLVKKPLLFDSFLPFCGDRRTLFDRRKTHLQGAKQ